MKKSPCLAGPCQRFAGPALRDTPVAELAKQFDRPPTCGLCNLTLRNASYPI